MTAIMNSMPILKAMPKLTLKRQLNEQLWNECEKILEDMPLPEGMWLRVCIQYHTLLDKTTIFALKKIDGVMVREVFEFDGYTKPAHFIKPLR